MLLLLSIASAVLGLATGTSDIWMPSPFWQDGDTVYACAWDDVKFDWMINPNGSLVNIQETNFTFHSNLSDFESADMITSISSLDGNFTPGENTFIADDFVGRIIVGDTEVTLRRAQTGDSGPYSVTVKGEDEAAGDEAVVTSTINLVVADDLMTTDKMLHISKADTTFFNATTGKHHVVLECGHFTYTTPPPFDVVWTLPDRTEVGSTEYRDGRFRLVLPLPMRAGSYQCGVFDTGRACVRRFTFDSLAMDATEERIWLLEAGLSRAKDENQRQDNELRVLKEIGDRSQMCLVTDARSNSLRRYDTIKLRNVMHGDGYDAATGTFTAWYTGTYLVNLNMAVGSVARSTAHGTQVCLTTGTAHNAGTDGAVALEVQSHDGEWSGYTWYPLDHHGTPGHDHFEKGSTECFTLDLPFTAKSVRIGLGPCYGDNCEWLLDRVTLRYRGEPWIYTAVFNRWFYEWSYIREFLHAPQDLSSAGVWLMRDSSALLRSAVDVQPAGASMLALNAPVHMTAGQTLWLRVASRYINMHGHSRLPSFSATLLHSN